MYFRTIIGVLYTLVIFLFLPLLHVKFPILVAKGPYFIEICVPISKLTGP